MLSSERTMDFMDKTQRRLFSPRQGFLPARREADQRLERQARRAHGAAGPRPAPAETVTPTDNLSVTA
jgi:hypothetical protein